MEKIKSKILRARDSKKNFIIRLSTGAILLLFFCVTFFCFPKIVFSFIIALGAGIIFFVEWPRLFKNTDPFGWLLLPFWPTLSIVLAILLNQTDVYRNLIAFMIVVAASFDIGSYLFGSFFGKNKIAPSISPRKSWEGAIGGYLLTVTVLCVTLNIIGTCISIPYLLGVAFILCALSLSGDMFESWLKRRARVKDSADFLPGHGGLLDRCDGLLFMVPFFYLFREPLAKLFGLV